MIVVSFKHPRTKKLVYHTYTTFTEIPKQIRHHRRVYFLYGVHQEA